MKKILIVFSISVLLTSCAKSFVQVFDTSTTNTKLKGKYFVYENDTLKITYDFWANKGVLSVAIYNKLDKPIYIDWKNSAFIYNDNKLNYWIDETQTKTISAYGGYLYDGPLIKPGFAINEGIKISESSVVKPERISFIPPKSNYYRSQFYLLPINYYKLNPDCQKMVVPRNDKPKKETTVYFEDFSFDNSPLRFRNYIAITFSENSKKFFFVDNEFYLTSVKEMDYRHYKGIYLGDDKNGKSLYERPYKKPTSFRINLYDASIETGYGSNYD